MTAPDTAPPRPVIRPVMLTTFSQAFSAGSNFVIILALGRAGGTSEVGKYGLAFTVYIAALGLQRAALTDPLMARVVGSTAASHEEDDRALTCSAFIALLAAAVIASVGAVTEYHQLAILAAFLVTVLAEDAARYVLFRNGRHGVAALLDGLWFVLSCSAFLILRSHPGHGVALVIWGTGGSVAAVVGMVVLRFRPVAPSVAAAWWREHLWHSSRWLTLETASFQADQQVAAFGFTAMAGAALFGEYQLAGSLVGLSVFVTTGIGVVAISRFIHGKGDQIREAAVVSAASFATVAVVTGVLLATSHLVVKLLFGSRVTITNPVILATGTIYALVAAAGGMQALLRARRTERALPLARAVGLVCFAPLAVVVSAHHFTAALWILAAESLTYLLILTFVATRARVGTAEREEVALDVGA